MNIKYLFSGGSHGIGQAQSMSSGGTGCEDCPGYPGYLGIVDTPDKKQVPSLDTTCGIQGSDIDVGIMRPETKIAPDVVILGTQITYSGGVVPGRVGTYPIRPEIGTGVYPGDITPGSNGKYVGVQPGVPTISPGLRPGVMMPGVDGTYPGVSPGTVRPGTVTGGNGIYPGGVQPGAIRPGGDGMYPGGIKPGIVRPGGDVTYPGGIQPGIVKPGTDGTYPGGVQPGVVRPEGERIYPPGTLITSDRGIYPGGVQPGTIRPEGERIYPPGTLITSDRGVYPGGVQPGGISRGGVPIETGIGTYPGGVQPAVQPGQAVYPTSGVVTTSVTTSAITGSGAYPGGPTGPAGIYPAKAPGTYLGTGIYPSGIQPGTAPGTSVATYPSGVIPGGTISDQVVYPGGQTGAIYPGGLAPSILPSGSQIPGAVTGSVTGTDAQVVTYPVGRPIDGGQVTYPSGVIQPSRTPEGTSSVTDTRIYPGGVYPAGRDTVPVTYPGGTQQVIPSSGIIYPGRETYPGGGEVYPGGQYLGGTIGIPGGTSIPTGTAGIQYPTGIAGGPIGGQTIGEVGIPGRFPDQYPGGIRGQEIGQYPGRMYPGGIVGAGEVSQPSRPGISAGVVDDGADSQASSSVQQVDAGTQASASAQGKYGSGTAQSQVTGTYSGTGSFSAQAGTSDANKSAQTEISGGEQGASSNAQGVAGYGKSQTQVQLDSDSGATSTDAQSSGWNHGTNSQVQASSKGGMADAQANGEGNTSSQAQIGFQPYLKNETEEAKRRATPFRGSGTASAQSGTHRGQSQSQLQGSFQYGITYTGAAQAGSGSGAASSRKPFSFNITDNEFFKPFKPQSSLKKSINVEENNAQPVPPARSNYQSGRGLQSSSSSKQIVIVKDNSDDNIDRKTSSTKSQKDDVTYDDEYDEYADEDDYPAVAPPDSQLSAQEKSPEALPAPSSNPILSKTISQQSHSQSQTIQVAKGKRYDLHINQESNVPQIGDILQPGQSVEGYTIPSGFRGRVISTAGDETIAQGDGKSQSQTVSVVSKNPNNTRTPETRSLQSYRERAINRHTSNDKDQRSSISQNSSSDKHAKSVPVMTAKPNYYTVTNSFAGKMNGSNEPRKYEHRYYTKSSTCGYFTFSCNVVYGSNGRTKICKPKMPTYSNGTPMRC